MKNMIIKKLVEVKHDTTLQSIKHLLLGQQIKICLCKCFKFLVSIIGLK